MNIKIGHRVKKKIISFALMAALLIQCVFSNQTVWADSSVYLELTGYQMSYALKGYRTLYSVADPAGEVEEVGLVYGLTDRVTDDEMVVGSTNETVHSYAGTAQGISSLKYSDYEGATTYITTMELIKKVEFYNTSISIRAYAKLKDGSYIYSDISTMTVYRVASTLYNRCLMPSIEGHNYLYNDILTLIDPAYKFVDYNWGSTIVSPKTADNGEAAAAEDPVTVVMDEETTTELEIIEEITSTDDEIIE